ncbi:MAG: aldo/keto reductase [Cyanobacteria bacterium J06635_15]
MVKYCQTRRNFLLTALSATGGALGASACQQAVTQFQQAQSSGSVAATQETAVAITDDGLDQITVMPERPFGATGLTLPVLGLGGSASPLSRANEEAEAIAIIQKALDLGIRYFDTAASYGPSETFLGKVLPAYRSEVVIATKTRRFDYDGAWRDLEQSLQRLNTDRLDLWQFHGLAADREIDTLLNPQTGAIKAAQEAQAQGLVRHVGVTGHHSPDVIATALQRYSFDATLVPVNAADKHTPRPFTTHLLPIAHQQNVAVIAMKVPAYGRLFQPGVLSGMSEAMGYALSQPGVSTCIIAAENIAQLEENVAVAQAWQPMPADLMASVEQRTAAVWQENSFFRRWT